MENLEPREYTVERGKVTLFFREEEGPGKGQMGRGMEAKDRDQEEE
jgi:hypothetical protein